MTEKTAPLTSPVCTNIPSGVRADVTRGRMLSYQLKDQSGRAEAIRRIDEAFRAKEGNAMQAAQYLGVTHRALMYWVAEYPELKKRLAKAREVAARRADKKRAR